MKRLSEQYRLIAFAGLVLLFVLYIGNIWQGIQGLMGVMGTLIMGGVLAFIFNVPMKKIEKFLGKCKVPVSMRRGLALLIEMIAFLLIIAGVISVVVPTLSTAVSQLRSTIETVFPQILSWIQDQGWLSSSQISQLTSQLQSSGLVNNLIQILAGLTGNVTSIFSNLFSVLMAVFLMFAILGSKEHLQEMTVRILKITMPKKAVERLSYMGSVIVETYDKFLMGQLIEAVIVGTLVFVAYSLVGLPYAGLTGVLTGVLSFIPYIGPFSACGLGAIFIFTVSPIQALLSIVVFQVVQLIEGNIIYPRVVGQSVGLPTLFTLAAALIGGNLFGILGMIFFTPIFAVIYRLIREFVEEKEAS